MRDSSTYMAIMEEGEALGRQKTLLRLGQKRFGEPDMASRTALEAITDLDRLDRLSDRLLEAKDWNDLLQTA